MFRLVLIIPNFILSALFVAHNSNDAPELYLPSVLFLSVSLLVNFCIAINAIYKGIKNPVIVNNFKEWDKKHQSLVAILIILAVTDYGYLTILKDVPMFMKKYEQINIFNLFMHISGAAITWGAFLDIFFRNIPQIIIQVSVFIVII
ncbi:hypothetical protein C2G38_1227056 [Gigaspora rosea]|uniref:Uncharacterized protein n=1 Tax=Gigaspora rosea TaxID=44941 RepID=A0A397VC26_9GLOM|nr:hypothetical protein C2G38_1227056 [Gigaspora rosea]